MQMLRICSSFATELAAQSAAFNSHLASQMGSFATQMPGPWPGFYEVKYVVTRLLRRVTSYTPYEREAEQASSE